MRMLYNFLVFALCVNLSAYLIPLFIPMPTSVAPYQSPENIAGAFSLNPFERNFLARVLVGSAGAVGITVAAFIFKQGTFAIYALIIWAIGVFFPPVFDFIAAVPRFINMIAPVELGIFTTAVSAVLTAIFTFAGFMFLMEIVLQRNLT